MSQDARLHTMPSRETDTMTATTPSPLPDPPAGSPGGLGGPRGPLHQLAPPSQASSAISRLLSLHPTYLMLPRNSISKNILHTGRPRSHPSQQPQRHQQSFELDQWRTQSFS